MTYNFADGLRRARRVAGYTQSELASRAGLTASHISHFESGRREPSLKNAIALSVALNCSLDWLCKGGQG